MNQHFEDKLIKAVFNKVTMLKNSLINEFISHSRSRENEISFNKRTRKFCKQGKRSPKMSLHVISKMAETLYTNQDLKRLIKIVKKAC